MTVDRICPILSAGLIKRGKFKSDIVLGKTSFDNVYCLESKCALWSKKHGVCGLRR